MPLAAHTDKAWRNSTSLSLPMTRRRRSDRMGRVQQFVQCGRDVFERTHVRTVKEHHEQVDGFALHRFENRTGNLTDRMASKGMFA